jgi:hypothetical protein
MGELTEHHRIAPAYHHLATLNGFRNLWLMYSIPHAARVVILQWAPLPSSAATEFAWLTLRVVPQAYHQPPAFLFPGNTIRRFCSN